MRLSIKLNHKLKRIEVPTNRTLMDVLRSQGCWSIKHGCETATCGNCTVLLNGQAVYSCHLLAMQADGKSIETYEGIENDVKYDPLRQAFSDFVDPECSYCLPGFILSLKALLDANVEPVEEEITDALAGNCCRCAATRLPIGQIIKAAKIMRKI